MKLIKVTQAEYLEGYKLKLHFSDDTAGIIDLEQELYGEVFEPLIDVEFFKAFQLDTWTVCWPNGADFSPEFLHSLAMKNQLELVNK